MSADPIALDFENYQRRMRQREQAFRDQVEEGVYKQAWTPPPSWGAFTVEAVEKVKGLRCERLRFSNGNRVWRYAPLRMTAR
jgi:hypothetical protein